MAGTKVFPTHSDAMSITHPINGKLREKGSEWEMDGFTSRMITDGSLTLDESKGWTSKEPAPDLTKPPEHATGEVDKPRAPPPIAASSSPDESKRK